MEWTIDEIVKRNKSRDHKLIEIMTNVFPRSKDHRLVKKNDDEAKHKNRCENPVCEMPGPYGINLKMNQLTGQRGMRKQAHDDPRKENDFGKIKINSVCSKKPGGKRDFAFKYERDSLQSSLSPTAGSCLGFKIIGRSFVIRFNIRAENNPVTHLMKTYRVPIIVREQSLRKPDPGNNSRASEMVMPE